MVVYKNGTETRVNDIMEALEVLGRKVTPGKKKNLAKYCGKLKRGYDGVQYQREARYGWD